MIYTVVLTEPAEREIVDAAQWWARNRSVDQATRWYERIPKALASLKEST